MNQQSVVQVDRRFGVAFLASLTLGAGTALAQPSGEIDPAEERFLLVRWHSVEQANDARNGDSPFLHAVRAQINWTSRLLPEWSVIEIPQGTAIASREVLRLDPSIAQVCREAPIRPTATTTPDDDYWPSQEPTFDLMKTRCAWDVRTHSDVIVAGLDNGVNWEHPDLFPNIWRNTLEINASPGKDEDGNGIVDDLYGASFILPNDPYFVAPGDPRGNMLQNSATHGTPMASIMGAVGNNSAMLGDSYIAGVFWTGQIMPVQVYGGLQHTGFATFKGMEYAYLMGARIMNCSFQMVGPIYTDVEWMKQFMEATPDALYVTSAGNGAFDLDDPASPTHYPAMFTCDNMIVLGNSDLDDEPFEFQVPTGGTCWGAETVDVFATGFVCFFNADPNQVAPVCGITQASTSAATAYTSGLAALVWSEYPAMTAIQVKQHLMNTADPILALDGLCVSGARINAAAAMGTSCPP